MFALEPSFLCTHQPFAVAKRHPGSAVLVLEEAHVVAAIHQVVPPLQAPSPPVLHREVFGHQMGVQGEVQVKVLSVGRQSVEEPGLWSMLRGLCVARAQAPHGRLGGTPSASARSAVLQGVAEEVPVLIHPHGHRQLVVVQEGQELLFYTMEAPEVGGRRR